MKAWDSRASFFFFFFLQKRILLRNCLNMRLYDFYDKLRGLLHKSDLIFPTNIQGKMVEDDSNRAEELNVQKCLIVHASSQIFLNGDLASAFQRFIYSGHMILHCKKISCEVKCDITWTFPSKSAILNSRWEII